MTGRTQRLFGPLGAVTFVIFVFVYLPLVVVLAHSFNASRHGARWGGFTLEWYRILFQNAEVGRALWNTAVLAVMSTLIATFLGTLLGYGLARHQFRGRGVVNRLLLLPLCVPDIVMAVALLLFFSLVRYWISSLQFGLITMMIGHVTFQIPFVAMVVSARLQGLDPLIEEAAADLGATPAQRFVHVTLPLLVPGILAGALLALTLSLDDFVVSFFTSGAGSTTLPILIYSSVKRGITPEIHALSSLLILASVLATVCAVLLQKKQRTESPHETPRLS